MLLSWTGEVNFWKLDVAMLQEECWMSWWLFPTNNINLSFWCPSFATKYPLSLARTCICCQSIHSRGGAFAVVTSRRCKHCWIIIAVVFTNNQRTVLKTFYEWNCIESNKAVRIHLFSPQFKLFVVWNQADCGLIHRNVLFYGVYLLELPDCIASPVCWHQIDDIHW